MLLQSLTASLFNTLFLSLYGVLDPDATAFGKVVAVKQGNKSMHTYGQECQNAATETLLRCLRTWPSWNAYLTKVCCAGIFSSRSLAAGHCQLTEPTTSSSTALKALVSAALTAASSVRCAVPPFAPPSSTQVISSTPTMQRSKLEELLLLEGKAAPRFAILMQGSVFGTRGSCYGTQTAYIVHSVLFW